MAERQLREHRQPPDSAQAQRHAVQQLPSTPRQPSQLGAQLEPKLVDAEQRHRKLSAQLEASSVATTQLVQSTREHLTALLARTVAVKDSHELLEEDLNDFSEQLVSPLSVHAQGGRTLREQLVELEKRRKELTQLRRWFAVLVEAEQLGMTVLQALRDRKLEEACTGYVALVEYVRGIQETAPALALTTHLLEMVRSVSTSMVQSLSSVLLAALEKLGWPNPFAQAIDLDDEPNLEFRAAFLDLLKLESLFSSTPLPGASTSAATSTVATPLLAITPFIQPLVLRFRWHFDGMRGTNRVDKPEYALSHVLNLITTHERFLSNEIQDLLDQNGFEHIDAVTEFTTLLLPLLAARLTAHIPQLLALPPGLLAHCIYSVLEFDASLKSRGYRPRVTGKQDGESVWKGLSDIVLGRKEWFDKWLEGEKEFFTAQLSTALASPTAFVIIPVEDYEATLPVSEEDGAGVERDGTSGVRPTEAALRVVELSEMLTERYMPLPPFSSAPFLLGIQLPLLNAYSSHLNASLDAFDSLAFALIPGALSDATAARNRGFKALQRICTVLVSARWTAERLERAGEEAGALVLGEWISEHLDSLEGDLGRNARELLSVEEGSTIFDRLGAEFGALARRSEAMLVRDIVRDVLGELKAYIALRRDHATPETDEPLTLSPTLIPSLSLLSSLLKALAAALPSSQLSTLSRKVAITLSRALYDRMIVNRTWSEEGGRQLRVDFCEGWTVAAASAGGKKRGWELLEGASILLALPASTSSSSPVLPREGKEVSFSKIMQLAFEATADEERDDELWCEAMRGLGVDGERFGRKEGKEALRRRPECWR